MDSSKKTTPVSQRGIGAFLTGPNAAKYSDPNLPTRERPPKKQKLFLTTITEDGLGNALETPAAPRNGIENHAAPETPTARGADGATTATYSR